MNTLDGGGSARAREIGTTSGGGVTRPRVRHGRFLLVLLCAVAGCVNPGLFWAPRGPGAARVAKPVAQVRLVEIGKPDCDYEVIGTTFGASVRELLEPAAAVGGDGVYDTACVLEVGDHFYFVQAHEKCSGRVYVCKGAKTAAAGATRAATPDTVPPASSLPLGSTGRKGQ